MRTRAELAGVVFLVFLNIGGCPGGARISRIHRFDVTPSQICPNQTVRVTASVSPEGSVWVRPTTNPMWLTGFFVPEMWAGRDYPAGNVDFEVILQADGLGRYAQRRWVHVVHEGREYPIRFFTPSRCEGGVIIDRGTIDADALSSSMRVYDVTAGEGRAISVIHNGRGPFMLPAQIAELRGQPVIGEWIIMRVARLGECTGTVAGGVIPSISVTVSATCDGNAPRPPPFGGAPGPGAAGCGNSGQRCCNNPDVGSCYGNGVCQNGTVICLDGFVTTSGTTTCSGMLGASPTQRPVVLRDENGCLGTFSELAQTQEEAVGCAQAQAAATGHTGTREATGPVDEHPVCITGPTGLRATRYMRATSADDALSCARAENKTSMVTAAACPP